MKKYKVLLIAEAANPEWVSVPLVGWSMANALRAVADVHLVTQIRNKDAILRAGLTENDDVTFIDSEAIAKPLYKIAEILRGGKGVGWTTTTAISALAYYYFEHLVWSRFKQRISDGEFDIVHRVTPLSPVTPSLITKKCHKNGTAFILGPINGGVPWPREFDKERRQEKEWLSYVRDAYKLLPGYQSTLMHSSALLVGSTDTLKQIPKKYYGKCVFLPENAVDKGKFSLQSLVKTDQPIRACFVGRLVPYKGADMAIEAVTPLIKEGKLIVDIIGDGPLMPDLNALIKRHEIQDGALLHGWVEHSKVQDIMHLSQLFIFPSIREFGGGAVLEAMALGLVPIVVDYAGPADLVTQNTGIKIPLGTRENIISELRKSVRKLVENPSMIDEIRTTSMRRVDELFTWDRKAHQVIDVYTWVMAHSKSKPNFFPEQKNRIPELIEQ